MHAQNNHSNHHNPSIATGISTSKIILILSAFALTAFSGSNGVGSTTPETPTIVTANSAEPAGNNCKFGGTRTDSGSDTNGNGILDAPEFTGVSYLCTQGESFDGLVYRVMLLSFIPPWSMAQAQ